MGGRLAEGAELEELLVVVASGVLPARLEEDPSLPATARGRDPDPHPARGRVGGEIMNGELACEVLADLADDPDADRTGGRAAAVGQVDLVLIDGVAAADRALPGDELRLPLLVPPLAFKRELFFVALAFIGDLLLEEVELAAAVASFVAGRDDRVGERCECDRGGDGREDQRGRCAVIATRLAEELKRKSVQGPSADVGSVKAAE